MNVPLLDLKAQIEPLKERIMAAITDVVDSTRYILGPHVTQLEELLADYCSTKYAVGVSSGTDALLISLMCLDVGPGDSVITTPYSFFATAGVIARVGARPIFVDIDAASFNIDPQAIAHALQDGVSGTISRQPFDVSKVKVIIPVHLYGQCADMEHISHIAEAHSAYIIEDAAQAIGAECPMSNGIKKAGSIGHIGCFSFFPSKNLGCMGDAGMVVTNDQALGEKLRILRVHGGEPKYYHKIIGGNFRLDPMQAAIIKIKQPYLNKWHTMRGENALFYDQQFKASGLLDSRSVAIPQRVYSSKMPDNRFDHIYNQYVIRVKERDTLREFLKSRQIGTEIYYPVPFHLQECFAGLGYKEGDFPESEKAAKETLALPIYPELSREQQSYVVQSIVDFYA
ncbi:MAG: DegT/DnrJ/EryC1/StrS family aminotransferase [bacterium]